MRRGSNAALALILGLVIASPAAGVIMRLTPLKEVLRGEQFIFIAKVQSVDAQKPSMILTVDEDLKGKAPFRRLPVNLTGDNEGRREQHPAKLLKRISQEMPLAVFASARGKKYTAFAYSNGTWFQMTGLADEDPTVVRWSFTHCEPYLRRTFKGSTSDLRQAIVDGLAGKKEPPEPNAKEPPGLGPEISAEGGAKDTALSEGWEPGPPLWCVIPTFVVMGPLALLSAIFPAVFGGLALRMRRWSVALGIASLDSTIFFLHSWFDWPRQEATMWLAIVVVTLLGVAISWMRQRGHAQATQTVDRPIEASAYFVPAVVALFGLAFCVFGWSHGQLFAPPYRELLPIWSVAWGFVVLGPIGSRVPSLGRNLEAALLLVLAGSCALVGLATRPRVINDIVWQYEAPERGTIASTPLLSSGRLYVGLAQSSGLSSFGSLVCLDANTGALVWSFDDDKDMKQVFSSPCLADGRIYVGEGFHQDGDCKLYCLDAATGKKHWSFATKSHTESSPRVVDDKVYFGAGEDGVFCLDATTGKELWHFEGLHVDTSLAVSDGQVFGGSGYGSFELFCLAALTGKATWRLPMELPAFGSPTLAGERVLFGLGNGDLLHSAEKPAGMLLCLDRKTGQRLWSYPTGDAVHAKPVVAGNRAIFCSRDHHCYCVELADGRLVWKRDLGSPAVAAPVVIEGSVWAVGAEGKLIRFDADTGVEVQSVDLAALVGGPVQVLASFVVEQAPQAGPRVYMAVGRSDAVGSRGVVYRLGGKQ